jgi:hypothetical protein
MLRDLTIKYSIPIREVRLLFFRAQEIEAIKICITDIFDNLEFYLDKKW